MTEGVGRWSRGAFLFLGGVRSAEATSEGEPLQSGLSTGTSALCALTSGATAPDRVIDELKAYDFEIISTNLPEEQEQRLREAFAQEQ